MSDWIENQNVIGGSTSKSVRVELVKTDGTAKTDAAYTDVTAYYYRPAASAITSITMATLAAVDTAYSSGGFKHISNGVYRFDLPDTAIAAITGGGKVLFTLSVSGCFPCNFELTIVTENASTLSARLPAALTTDGNIKADALRVAGTAQTARDLGAQLAVAVSTPPTAVAIRSEMDSNSTQLSTIVSKTNLIPASPAAVGSAMTLTSAYDAAKTAAQASDIPSANITAIKAKTDNLPNDPADASDISSAFSTVNSTLTTIAGYIDTEVAAIKAKTDNIPASPAAVSDVPSAASVASAVRTELTTELSHLNADVDSRAPAATALSNATWTDTKAGYLNAAISSISGGGGGGSVSGAYTVTLTVTDGTSPLQSARVRVGEGVTFETYVTDASGQVQISRDAGTYRVAITKDGYSFDPVERTVTGDDAGTITNDLEMTAVALPGPSDDASMCRVFGYFETVDNNPAAAVPIEFKLVCSDAVKSERMIAGRIVKVVTNSEGRLTDGTNFYVELQRNDLLTPSETYYEVTSDRLGLNKKKMILTTDTFDLSNIIDA